MPWLFAFGFVLVFFPAIVLAIVAFLILWGMVVWLWETFVEGDRYR